MAGIIRGQNPGIRITSETAPLGGMVQVKIFATAPQAIASGNIAIQFDDNKSFPKIVATEVFSASGDASGFASYEDLTNEYWITFSSPSASIGRLPDLPIAELTVVVDKPHVITIDPTNTTFDLVQAGSIAVGGTLSLSNANPGGGVVPISVPIELSGTGFTPDTSVAIEGATIAAVNFVSTTQINVTLATPTEMTGKHVIVQNPDGEQVDYWPWLNGNYLGTLFALPIFPPSVSTMSASCSPQIAPGLGVFLAVQNSNSTPAVITLTNTGNGVTDQPSTTTTLPAASVYSISAATAPGIPVEHDFTSTSRIQIWCLITGFDLRSDDLKLAPIRYNSSSPPTMASLVSGASLLDGSVSPGEIITIFGSNFSATGTTVLFDNVSAPVIYQSATQLNIIVPYEVATESIANVTVQTNGVTSAAWGLPVEAAAPGIFSFNSSGVGQAAVVNQDGTVNGPNNPAPLGSFISIYATGEGQTSPAGVDGKVAQVPAPQPVLAVTVNIGGQTVTPQYAGGAPGEVAGVLQVNAQIPASSPMGAAVPITLQIGNNTSQTVTVAISAK